MPRKNKGTESMSMVIVSVHLPKNVVKTIETLVESGVYPNRSEFIRSAVVEKLVSLGALGVTEKLAKRENDAEDINVITPQFMPKLELEDAKEMRTGDAVYAMMPPCYIQSSALLTMIQSALSRQPANALYAMLRRHRNNIDIISIGDLVFYRRMDAAGDWRANTLCREYSLEAYLNAVTRGILHLLSSTRAKRACVRSRSILHAIVASVRSPHDITPHAIVANPAVRLSLTRFTAKLLGVYDGEIQNSHATLICLKKP